MFAYICKVFDSKQTLMKYIINQNLCIMLWLTKIIKKISTGLNPGMKFLPALVRQPNMTKNEVEQEVADLSSLSPGDVSNVFKNFGRVLGKSAQNGRSVETEIGIFQIQLKVTSANTLEELTVDNVLKVNIRYIPSKEVQKSYKKENNQLMFVDVTPSGHQEKTPEEDPMLP